MTNNMDELNERFKKSAENFSLIPSSGIWENVSRDIRYRERKRKFIIYFLILAGILAGGSLLFINHTAKQSPETFVQTNNPDKQKQTVTSEKNAPLQKSNQKSIDQAVTEKHLTQNSSIVKKEKRKTEEHSQINNNSQAVINSTFASTQTISNAPHLNQDNLVLPEINTSVIHTAAAAITDSIKTKDSSQTNAPIEVLYATKSDTIKKDSLIANKDSVKTIPPKSKWSIAIGIAPAKSFADLQEKGDYRFIAHYRDSTDKNIMTWNYHLNISYNLLEELEIYTGIGIINFEQQILSQQTVYKYDTGVTTGPFTPPVITVKKATFNINNGSASTVKNKLSYLAIPLGISYQFLSLHDFSIYLQPEISFCKLIRSEGYMYNFTTREYEPISSNKMQSWMVSYGIGMSFQYSISKNLKIELAPFYLSLQKSVFNPSYSITQKFQQEELRFSFRYAFK